MPWQFFTKSGVEKHSASVAGSPVGDYNAVGVITPFAGSTAPSGWLLCQGQQVEVALYPALYSALGVTYGSLTNGNSGAGSSHFRVPDLRGRTVIGTGQLDSDGVTGSGTITASGSTTYALAAWGGSESVTLTAAQSGIPSHGHSVTVGSHNHTYTGDYHAHRFAFVVYDTGNSANAVYKTADSTSYNGTFSTSSSSISASITSSTSGITSTNSTSASAVSSHENMQNFLVLNYIIKT